jgi:hypothetical protein
MWNWLGIMYVSTSKSAYAYSWKNCILASNEGLRYMCMTMHFYGDGASEKFGGSV